MTAWIRPLPLLAIGLQATFAQAAEKYEGEFLCKSNITAGAERVGSMISPSWKPMSGVNENTQFLLRLTPTDNRTAYWVQMQQSEQGEPVPCKSTIANTYEIEINKFGDLSCTVNHTLFQASLLKKRFAWIDVYEHLAFDTAKYTTMTLGECVKQ